MFQLHKPFLTWLTSNVIFTVWISGGQIIDIRVTTHRNSSEAFKCHYIRGPCSALSWRGVAAGGKEGHWRAWISFNSRLTSSYLSLVMVPRGRGGVTTWCVTQDPHRWLFQLLCSGRIETIISLYGSSSRRSCLRQYTKRLLHPWKHLAVSAEEFWRDWWGLK